MMRTLELSRHRRANIWLDEAPPADFTATSVVARVVKPKLVVEAMRTTAGIELTIPHGPSASYALLGGELVEANVEGLEVVVSVNSMGLPFQRSLALQPDEVKVGLLEEYAHAVVAGVSKMAESSGVPGKAALQFRWAAHGLVGSSPSVFEKMGVIVVQLLMLPRGASDDQLVTLLRGL